MTLNFLKGVGNQHIEAGRVLWVLSCLTGMAYAGFHLYINHAFSIIEFGTGMGALLGLGGGGIALKDMAVAKAAATNADSGATGVSSSG